MVLKNCSRPVPLFGILALALWAGVPSAMSDESPAPSIEPALVRVILTTRTRGPADTVEINGKLLRNSSPIIIQVFSSTGVILDRPGYILTFLGKRWIDINDRAPQVEIASGEGRKWKGQLIGIDQNNGAAVVRLLEGKLKETPLCVGCAVKDGSIVIAPVIPVRGLPQLHRAQVVSVGAVPEAPDQEKWTMTVNRPFPDIGLPILDPDLRVLGFVASQDPASALTSVYPIDQLLSSAEKIIRKGGDIQIGWLGVFIADSETAAIPGIKVEQVAHNSPAQKAGLSEMDWIVGYDGRQIKDSLQFIRLVESTPIKSKVKVDIVRNGKPMTLAAVIEPHTAHQAPRKFALSLPDHPSLPASRPVVGLDARMLNPELAKELDISSREGLLVVGVTKQTPADLAGVLVGDVIVAIDGEPIKDSLSFSSYLQTLSWGAQLKLKVLRKELEKTILVQLPPQP